MANKKTKTGSSFHLRVVFARFYKLLTFLIVILILGGGYLFILEPKYRESGQGSKDNLNLSKTELLRRQQHLNQLKKLVDKYNSISPKEISRIKMILPEGKDIPGLFVQFQTLAAKNNLLLSSISFDETPMGIEKDAIKKININVDLLGGSTNSYQEVKSFIASVETNLRLLDIDSIFFNPESSAYSLTVVAYYY